MSRSDVLTGSDSHHPPPTALFEGLAGSGADINVVCFVSIQNESTLRLRQIFDIEDEMERALGFEDDPDHILIESSQNTGLERRVSRRSSHPSTRSLRPAQPPSPKEQADHAPPRSNSPQQNGGHQRHTSAPISFRRRLTPSIHKPDVAQSPLAQVFQPIVLDEAHAQPDATSDSASGGGMSVFLPHPQLSYGPATRRRLASFHSVYKRPNETPGRPTFPPLDTREETLAGRFSASPDNQEEERNIATAEQVEEQVEGNGGMTEWMKRMEGMEQRQQRIEDLLVQLHAQLQH